MHVLPAHPHLASHKAHSFCKEIILTGPLALRAAFYPVPNEQAYQQMLTCSSGLALGAADYPVPDERAYLQTLTTRACFGIRGSNLSQTARVPAKLVARVVAASSAPKVLPLKAMPAWSRVLQFLSL